MITLISWSEEMAGSAVRIGFSILEILLNAVAYGLVCFVAGKPCFNSSLQGATENQAKLIRLNQQQR